MAEKPGMREHIARYEGRLVKRGMSPEQAYHKARELARRNDDGRGAKPNPQAERKKRAAEAAKEAAERKARDGKE